MSTHRAASGELIDVRPYGDRLTGMASVAVVRDAHMEVMRLVLPAGKVLPEHFAYGPVTIQCVEGAVDLSIRDAVQPMRAGDLVYLAAQEPHALRATEDASLLVTMVLRPSSASRPPAA